MSHLQKIWSAATGQHTSVMRFTLSGTAGDDVECQFNATSNYRIYLVSTVRQ